MENNIVKTTAFRDHHGCKVLLEEMQDGQKHVRKTYGLNNVSFNNIPLDDEERWVLMKVLERSPLAKHGGRRKYIIY